MRATLMRCTINWSSKMRIEKRDYEHWTIWRTPSAYLKAKDIRYILTDGASITTLPRSHLQRLRTSLPLAPEQRIYLVLTSSSPPLNELSVLVPSFLRKGTEETSRAAFNPIYDLGPSSNPSAVTPCSNQNNANIVFCTCGDRKPAYSTTIIYMQPDTWSEIWYLYKAFQAKGRNSTGLTEL
jgi:hypothetical protein